ncbi:hypothetical protein WJX72_004130 [[Myrmecia] bisecta]|uniref:Uncharacterized protein n=1 Tax=[Myrmecia] bisecta TaxID=41462 RepID=A0AAW1R5N7_9CHLO
MRALLAMAEDAAMALKIEFKKQVFRLPPKVRSMPLAQFHSQFGGDINAVLLEEVHSRLQAAQQAAMPPPGTSLRSRRGAGATAEPATVMRTTRKVRGAAEPPPRFDEVGRKHAWVGDELYSKNGSPMGVFEQDQVTKQPVLATPMPGGLAKTSMQMAPVGAVDTVIRTGKLGARTKASEAILITTKDGSQIAVEMDGGLQKVPAKYRQEVGDQLNAMKTMMEAMLQ